MEARILFTFVLFIVMASFMASATDPNQLDDFCVAPKDPGNAVWSNGRLCKNPLEVTADDFIFRGLNVRTDTSINRLGNNNIPVNPSFLPGLNTLGISLARFDYAAKGGLVPPHIHPRGTEVITLLEGTLHVGFVGFNQSDNTAKLYSQVLSPGDVFVYPQALVHFGLNIGETNATAISMFSSQNPGNSRVATALFESKPPILVDLLAKTFRIDPKIVEDLQSKF